MPYDTSQFSPGYGGKINSAGNVVNIADAFDTTTSSLKVETVPATNMSGLFTLQNAATAIGNGTPADVSGYATLSLDVVISATAAVSFEASLDGTNYFAMLFSIPSTASTGTTLSASNRGLRFNVSGVKWFRARISAYTSGTVDVTGYASMTNTNPIYSTAQTVDGLANQTNLSATAGFLMGFNGTTWDRVKTVNTGQLRTTTYSSAGLEVGIFNVAVGIPDGSALGVGGLVTVNTNFGFNGSTFDRVRVGKIYKYIEYLNLADNTATTVWTPASGKKFRLMAVQISSSAASLLHLRDGAGGTIFHTQRTAGIDSKYFEFGNGYISSTANNVLEILNKSTATINVWVTAWGTEE